MIKILYFGIYRDITNKFEEPVQNFKDTESLVKHLTEKYPEFNTHKDIILSVNLKYVDKNTDLKDGDEVAIMAPVSGG